jgi:hypothetical protein
VRNINGHSFHLILALVSLLDLLKINMPWVHLRRPRVCVCEHK